MHARDPKRSVARDHRLPPIVHALEEDDRLDALKGRNVERRIRSWSDIAEGQHAFGYERSNLVANGPRTVEIGLDLIETLDETAHAQVHARAGRRPCPKSLSRGECIPRLSDGGLHHDALFEHTLPTRADSR